MTRVAALAIALGAAFAALVVFQPIADSDLFWHLQTGRSTIAGDLPRVDTFSWTIAGAPVATDQWLGDALIAGAQALGGWRGLLLLRALAVALLVLSIVDAALVSRPRAPLIATFAALPAILLTRFAWTDRPELFGLVCFALLVRFLRGGDAGLLATIPLIFVWSQLHGSYALGLGIVLLACAARAFEDRRERWRYVPIAAAAIVATLLTPAGLGAWTASGGHFLTPPRYIAEEGVPDARTTAGAVFLAVLALVILTAMLTRRVTLREAALIVPVAFLSLTAERHTPFLAVAAAPYFASRWPDPLSRWRAAGQAPAAVPHARAIASALGAAAILLAVALSSGTVDDSGYPRGALVALPSGPGLLNEYVWGGYLIAFAPNTPVFIDGRLFPFVPGVLEDYRAIIGAHPGWEQVAAARGVRALLVRPTQPIAVRARERGWRVVYEDDVAIVLLR